MLTFPPAPDSRYAFRMDRRGTLARDLGLLVVVFVATLVLLLGLSRGLNDGGPGGSAATSPDTSASGVAVSPSGSTASESPPGESPSASASTAGPSPASGDPVLVGAGDIGDCGTDGDEATAKLIEGIDGTVFAAGDNAYPNGSSKNYEECYDPTWGQFKDRTKPVPGNHEYETAKAAGYRDYFGAAAVNADDDTWYSFDLGTWHVVMLDSACSKVGGCKKDDPQGRWLADDLAASRAACTLAIWHEPRFSSGFHGNDRTVGPFWDLLYDAGADVIVNGHDHDYERFAPQDPDANEDRERGIREFVVGTGGTTLRRFEDTAENSELRATVSHGVLKLVLHPTSYDWEFVPTEGPFSDSGTGPCH